VDTVTLPWLASQETKLPQCKLASSARSHRAPGLCQHGAGPPARVLPSDEVQFAAPKGAARPRHPPGCYGHRLLLLKSGGLPGQETAALLQGETRPRLALEQPFGKQRRGQRGRQELPETPSPPRPGGGSPALRAPSGAALLTGPAGSARGCGTALAPLRHGTARLRAPAAAPAPPRAVGKVAGLTSYWMYCFRHSGVMCAARCSANFILPPGPGPRPPSRN